jgi:hypothetical protein
LKRLGKGLSLLEMKGFIALFEPPKISGMEGAFKGSEYADFTSSSTIFFFPSDKKPSPVEFWKGAKRPPLEEMEERFPAKLGIPVAKFVGKGLGFSTLELSEPLFWAGLI